MRARESGMTIVELAIVAAFLIPVLFAIAGSGGTIASSINTNEVNAKVAERSRMVSDRIAGLIRGASLASVECYQPSDSGPGEWLFPVEGTPYRALRFQIVTGLPGSPMSPVRTLEWRLDDKEVQDSRDNDGDGLVDEGQLILSGQPWNSVLIATNIEHFTLARKEHALEFSLQTARRLQGGMHRFLSEQHVELRNN